MSQLTAITQTDAPDNMPVTLAQVQAHMRVTLTQEDALISSYIAAATELVERWTRRQLVTAKYELALDGFPLVPGLARGGRVVGLAGGIEIPRPPLVSVQSIKYFDPAGVQQTLDPSLYQVDARPLFGRVIPAPGTAWPATQLGVLSSVIIAFTAGYSSTTAVPPMLKTAIMLLVAHWYEHREAATEAKLSESPMAVQALVGMYSLAEVW